MNRTRPSQKRYFAAVLPDLHTGYIVDTPTYSQGAWDVAVQALEHYAERLTHIIILGDWGNWEPLSHWASLRAEQAFIEEDVALARAMLAEVFKVADVAKATVVFCEGNHEAWATQFESKYPALRDTFNLRERLGFDGKHRVWVPENHFYALGDCYFTHGHARGIKKPLDMVRRKGVSVVYGHTHAYATESVRTLTGEHAAWSFGCLASIDPPPPYSKGEVPDRWTHGLGLVQVRANGRFQVSYRRIIDEAWTELEDGTEVIANPRTIKARRDRDRAIRRDMRKKYAARFFDPSSGEGPVIRPLEPHHGKTSADHAVARTRRARIVRTLPDAR